jgi:hypothetical protein
VGTTEQRGFVCNKCISDRSMTGVQFNALITRDLRSKFNATLASYLDTK